MPRFSSRIMITLQQMTIWWGKMVNKLTIWSCWIVKNDLFSIHLYLVKKISCILTSECFPVSLFFSRILELSKNEHDNLAPYSINTSLFCYCLRLVFEDALFLIKAKHRSLTELQHKCSTYAAHYQYKIPVDYQ